MARLEKPVLGDDAVAEFARALRRLRADNDNPPYATMAKTAMYSKTVLSQAAAGHRLPTWDAVVGFLRALGIGEGSLTYLAMRGRWESAKELGAASASQADRGMPGRLVDPDDIQTPAEFAAALGEMLARSRLSIRGLAAATAEFVATDREIVSGSSGFRYPLSRDAIANVLKGRRAPTPDFVYTFVRSCGHSLAEARAWVHQSRVIQFEQQRAGLALRALQQPAIAIDRLRDGNSLWRIPIDGGPTATINIPYPIEPPPIHVPRRGAHRAPSSRWLSRIIRGRRPGDDPAPLDDGRG